MRTSDEGYRAALRWLAQRALTAREVRDRLERQETEAADQVVARLLQEGWLSDQAVADLELRRAQSQGRGPGRLAQRLRQRGVDSQVAQDTLARWSPEDVWAQAEAIARRADAKTLADRQRLARKLQRQGFASADIVRALRMVAAGDSDRGEESEWL